jgi:hypothetical protein
MAMNWLKGLVAPPAQFPGQGGGPMPPQGMPPQGGPPIGGSPYGFQPPQGMPMAPPVAPDMAQGYQPPQWSSGTKTQGEAQGLSKGMASPVATTLDPGVGAPTVAQLQHDLEALALFARTLLTMLEEKNVVTRAQFEETKKRLDMLDGKLDDR